LGRISVMGVCENRDTAGNVAVWGRGHRFLI
jgi:hypothetical protein